MTNSIQRTLTLLLLVFISLGSYAQEKLVYVFEIKDEIAEPVWRTTKKAFEEAKELNADLVFLKLNTYGGAVNVADSIRTTILNSTIPVFVLIENNAASAGAFISIACDSIFMQPGSVMGAATVVDQNGEVVPDKYQSFMRTKMRATAEQTGRNPDIAEAMVDPDKEVADVSPAGKVLTLTVEDAKKVGYCNGEFNTIEQALAYSGYDSYKIVKQRFTTVDKIIGILVSPALSGILILVIFGGIYFELQSPGIGFPLAAAIIASALYFAPLYLEGLAENWEILLFVVGLVLIGIELFVIPGFGVIGIAGISISIFALTLSMIGNDGLDFSFLPAQVLIRSLMISLAAGSLSLIGSIFLATKLFESGAMSRLVMNTSLDKEEGYSGISLNEVEIINATGIAYTDLKPTGKVEINGEIYDANSQSGFIEKNALVKVIEQNGTYLKVRLIS